MLSIKLPFRLQRDVSGQVTGRSSSRSRHIPVVARLQASTHLAGTIGGIGDVLKGLTDDGLDIDDQETAGCQVLLHVRGLNSGEQRARVGGQRRGEGDGRWITTFATLRATGDFLASEMDSKTSRNCLHVS